MSDRAVVMAVASYPSRAAAARDFRIVSSAPCCRERNYLAAAKLEKGADGLLTIDDHHTAGRLACGAALLGGALIVVAAPLGIVFLVPALARKTAWAGVGAIVAHLWNNVPKGELRSMSDMVEMAQAALLVVALGYQGDDIKPLFANAAASVVVDVTPADLEAEFSYAVDEANAT